MNKKIPYERRVYESVDDNSLSYALSQKPTKKEFMKQRVKVIDVQTYQQICEIKNMLIKNRIIFTTSFISNSLQNLSPWRYKEYFTAVDITI